MNDLVLNAKSAFPPDRFHTIPPSRVYALRATHLPKFAVSAALPPGAPLRTFGSSEWIETWSDGIR
ncbi:MAG: hypothetical protein RBT76_01710 [candidate division Zixibacteria bacterium]|jgi:hypothetical protein|nr:hypothetical protein [candidate division Zixibacteria bacterium]